MKRGMLLTDNRPVTSGGTSPAVPDQPSPQTSGRGTLMVRELSTTFRSSGREIRAVRSVSFEVHPGRTLVLLGESGSGKSVTARALMRLHGPRAVIQGDVTLGEVDLLGVDDATMRGIRGARVALVPQDPSAALDPLRRVGGQITEVLRLHDVVPDKAAARTRAIELLGQVGIPDPERAFRSYPHELSGGMRQRVVIAMGISCDPEVIIADEPTTALDVTVQAQILDLFAELQRRLDTALLMVTHDVGVAADIADEVAVMYAGSIVETGPAREVLERPRHPYTQALLAAIPTPDVARGELVAIAGSPPMAGEDFPGCAFAGRCPFVQDSCRTSPPPLVVVESGHLAACPVINPVTATTPVVGPSTESTR
ncbi:MAG: oligopeptide/dipeptide transporter, ATPase subunit [Modestobacter sp.]|nr:oligopeptide/dipeptide transporter, ATPase subunit [Modestobacter sp.]